MSQKTVFISYRRDAAGKAFARSLKQELTHHGYDVFLDVDSIDPGKWAEQILTQVPQRSHFLLLLTPGALDRCADDTDWVRREYELAVKHGRNIVPVREESVDLTEARKTCPECMHSVFELQIATVQHEAFDQDIATLIERYIPPHKAPTPAASGEVQPVPRVAVSKLTHVADQLFGREAEFERLDAAWNERKINVITLVAWGGIGKTSLVAKWAARLAGRDYDGADYFDWSFYSQGTREQGGASADTFIAAALEFFGGEDGKKLANSPTAPWEKGARLAQLVARRRTLLVLDGLEPLQHPPGPLAGQLKDPAVAALLKGLAAKNPGLCLVTTRERVADLASFRDTTAPEWPLAHLPLPAGVALLKTLGVRGTAAEFERLVEDVAGHALTLNLLGRYLAKAHGGDIRRRDRVDLQKADLKTQGGHAFKTMAAYATWLAAGGDEGARQIAVLRLLGLFDRPADAGCLTALRRAPVIPGLTEPLVGLAEDDWNDTVSNLAECDLVSVGARVSVPAPSPRLRGEGWDEGSSLDAHPLIREYFAQQLRQQNPDAWRSAHGRLYEHLRDSIEPQPDTLEGLQPLYQAVAHGCQARRHEEVCNQVYIARILRRDEKYALHMLGAFGVDLGAVACFFEQSWCRVSPSLTETQQAWLLHEAAFRLRALGRLNEALEPMRASMDMEIEREAWPSAASGTSSVGGLEVTLGELLAAVRHAEQAVTFADRAGDAFLKFISRITLAAALHQAGRRGDALPRFREAEEIQAKNQPSYPLLYALSGFQYCELLLAEAERAASQVTLLQARSDYAPVIQTEHSSLELSLAFRACEDVE